ncbi:MULTISPECIES: hypothetical protein [unclassified Variovorax]|uniref:hypothetical protein n=1 Tax=unclassified Variovorax TaxID=663243 RepID=UPI0013A5992C|nr:MULTISPECIES: hypothetical protein [unclassified Variovorax]
MKVAHLNGGLLLGSHGRSYGTACGSVPDLTRGPGRFRLVDGRREFAFAPLALPNGARQPQVGALLGRAADARDAGRVRQACLVHLEAFPADVENPEVGSFVLDLV